MKRFLSKIFDLSDIRYSWLLLISMGVFILSLYNGKIHPQLPPIYDWVTYGSAFSLAVVWGILNYIDHIMLSAWFKKCNDIEAYVENLVMSKDEKQELKSYLEDYVQDLVLQGKTQPEATKMAIDQFKVQEFTSLAKNSSLLKLPIHYYLIGYTVLALAMTVILHLVSSMVIWTFWLLSLEFTLVIYAVGFLSLFFLYTLMDMVVAKRISRATEE